MPILDPKQGPTVSGASADVVKFLATSQNKTADAIVDVSKE